MATNFVELMTVGIIHAFLRWVLDVFAPGSGKRRAGVRPAVPAPERRPEAPRTAAPKRPAHRWSPCGRDVPVDGGVAPLVRPYVIAAEQDRERARQHRRRVAMVLAADFGIDLDQHLIGTEAVAR